MRILRIEQWDLDEKNSVLFVNNKKKTVQKEPLLLIFWTRVRLEILAKNTIEPLNRYAKCIEEVL